MQPCSTVPLYPAMTGGAGGGDVVAGAVNAAGWVRRLRKAMGMGGRR